MIPYATLFGHLRQCRAAWDAEDFRALHTLGAEGPRPTADETAAFVETFCQRAGRHVDDLGADSVGNLISYLMGAGEEVWYEVADASHENAEDAILSLQALYERCFAVHLTEWKGLGGEGTALAGVCYMLWDMNGGLEKIPLAKEPKALVPACYSVLEHALSLDSPACWESALHGLGHLALYHRERSKGMIDGFLAAKGRAVPDDLKDYALVARDGGVQ